MRSKSLKSNRAASRTNSVSPWERPDLDHLFRYELELAARPKCGEPSTVHPVLAYIHKHKLNRSLYKALTKFAPLVPVCSQIGRELSWVSPAGDDTSVFIIIGKDGKGKQRIVGGNMFRAPTKQGIRSKINVFDKYDSLDNHYAQEKLISNAVASHMETIGYAQSVKAAWAEQLFGVRAIYVLVIDGEKTHIAISHAVVRYSFPVDQSWQYQFGEVIL